MRILVTGASGFIGAEVYKELQKHPFDVVGLFRDREKAKGFSAHIGSLEDPLLQTGLFDCIIHCAFQDGPTDEAFFDKVCKDPPQKFLYTSGVWVYGSSHSLLTETTKPNPLPHVTWRPRLETKVLQSPFEAHVIRPAHVYGRPKGLFHMLLQMGREKNLQIVGDGSNVWSQVHVEDLAKLYVKLMQKNLPNSLFNGAEGEGVLVKEMAEKIADWANTKPQYISLEQGLETFGPLAYGLAVDQPKISSEKAKKELGWSVTHKGFLQEFETFL